MAEQLQNLLLVLDVVDVLGLNDVVLLHRLDGHLHAGVLLEPSEFDVSKSTYS